MEALGRKSSGLWSNEEEFDEEAMAIAEEMDDGELMALTRGPLNNPTRKLMKQFLIQSIEHQYPDGPVMWWGPHRLGYVSSIDRAGRYSEEAAREICKRANLDEINEVAWAEEDAHRAKNRKRSGQESKDD